MYVYFYLIKAKHNLTNNTHCNFFIDEKIINVIIMIQNLFYPSEVRMSFGWPDKDKNPEVEKNDSGENSKCISESGRSILDELRSFPSARELIPDLKIDLPEDNMVFLPEKMNFSSINKPPVILNSQGTQKNNAGLPDLTGKFKKAISEDEEFGVIPELAKKFKISLSAPPPVKTDTPKINVPSPKINVQTPKAEAAPVVDAVPEAPAVPVVPEEKKEDDVNNDLLTKFMARMQNVKEPSEIDLPPIFQQTQEKALVKIKPIYEEGSFSGIIIGKSTKEDVIKIMGELSKDIYDISSHDPIHFYNDISVKIFFNDQWLVSEIEFGKEFEGNTHKGLRIGDSLARAIELYGPPRMKSARGAMWEKFKVFCDEDGYIAMIKLQ